ncbi:hypothetical protein ACFGVR_15225 [Mucilaginibacter sp. AW1-3]
MKNLKQTLLALLTIAAIASCKKQDSVKTYPLASINVANVVVGGTALTLNNSALTVSSNNYAQLSVNAGNSAVNLHPAATPSVVYYNQNIQTTEGGYYSLFLSGPSPSSVDNVLIKESFTTYPDSTCGVRFINLAPGSNPVSVNISGHPNGSEVPTLAYKAYTDIKKYPADGRNPSYGFEFRDVATGNLIVKYTLSSRSFHNVTIVLRGIVGGSPAAGITLVKDY